MAHANAVALQDLVADLGGELIGGPTAAATLIDRIGPLEGASSTTIGFVSSPRYRAQLGSSKAGCVIVAPVLRDEAVTRGATIVTADPYLYFARLTQWWARRTRAAPTPGIHASAVVDAAAVVDATVSVGPLAVIEAGARVEAGCLIGAQCFVGRDAHIGAGTRLAAHVTFGAGCRIGERGIVHSGVVIGADGFGFAPAGGRWEKIEQFGAVRIGDDVEIGANTCIDRGALDDTLIENGVKLDNLIQLGHNVRIGEHSALAGCVGIAGSAVVGKHCTIGGAGMMVGHIEIGDNVHISGGTMVMSSITRPGHYTGVFPIDDNASWEKNAATLRRLHDLRNRVRALEAKLVERATAGDELQPAGKETTP